MTGWQVDQMVENAALALWEELNEPDPAEQEMKEAAVLISSCLKDVSTGLFHLEDAISALDGTPMADKLQSYMDQFDDLVIGLRELREHYERGERE